MRDFNDQARPLSPEALVKAFRRATCSMDNAPLRWRQRAVTGLTGAQLQAALQYEFGAMGGECGEGWLEYQGEGLKIWASDGFISRQDAPTLQGAATMRMARAVYGIADPDERQMGLF
jgi:hypothetical protein